MGRAGGSSTTNDMRQTRSSTTRSLSSRDSSPTKAATGALPGGARGTSVGRRRRSSGGASPAPKVLPSPSRNTRSQRSTGAGAAPLTMLSLDGITAHAQSFDSMWGVLEDDDRVKADGIISTPATRPSLTHFIKPRQRKRDIARPFVEKGLMSGLIYMMGEAIAGGLVYQNGQYGLYAASLLRKQVLHSALVGALANGPMLQLFFVLVDRLVTFESRVLSVATKVFIDQVVWGCFWNWCYILLMNIATDSPGFGYIGEGLGDKWHVRLLKGFVSAFWKASDASLHLKLLTEGLKMLPMDVMCYAFVPCSLRPLWVAAVDTMWVTILSKYD
uniref:Uncharacterized protein n=1 Tax=Hemiselmis tepida TaxID=464990 RepID=A0A7S0VVR1_9CRYP|mmetsp:Transcript_28637/g.72560  ORF Transcript_28637/g.72560 Transcript_28637/m.72560 type:complete len:330 (+) Transcript_28637:172-1161(+)